MYLFVCVLAKLTVFLSDSVISNEAPESLGRRTEPLSPRSSDYKQEAMEA